VRALPTSHHTSLYSDHRTGLKRLCKIVVCLTVVVSSFAAAIKAGIAHAERDYFCERILLQSIYGIYTLGILAITIHVWYHGRILNNLLVQRAGIIRQFGIGNGRATSSRNAQTDGLERLRIGTRRVSAH
jgi:hypothetical protein